MLFNLFYPNTSVVLSEFKLAYFTSLQAYINKKPDFSVVEVGYSPDIKDQVALNLQSSCVIYDLDSYGLDFAFEVTKHNPELPVFILAKDNSQYDLSLALLRLNLTFFEYQTDVDHVFNRMLEGVKAYRKNLLPPFTKKLFELCGENLNMYCTPCHSSGSAFVKSPVGKVFYDFYGANTFKSDLSISMTSLGSLLDHSGAHQEAENYISGVYQSDSSYIVTNGTSTANKIVGMNCVYDGATVAVDRNCHKSIAHLLMMSNVYPIYFKPTRNLYGLIGAIPQSEFKKASLERKVEALAQSLNKSVSWPSYAVITNATYDGLLYKTRWITENLEINNIHYDSAWVPYLELSEVYQDNSSICWDKDLGASKVIYETQSTHKLLAAFSQTSMIHIKGKLDKEIFNDSYMMHTSTSHFFPMVAAAETSAAMMKGQRGTYLINDIVKNVVFFRNEIKRINAENSASNHDWFFDVWQPDISNEALKCYSLSAQNNWHGFGQIDADYLSLDPLKVTIICPGVDLENNQMADFGIPAAVVTKFLEEHNIFIEKTGPYTILLLFGIGGKKAEMLKLLSTLLRFKAHYEQNSKIEHMLPKLYQKAPGFYAKHTIQSLAQEMNQLYKETALCHSMCDAYEVTPEMHLTPYQARQHVVKNQVRKIPLSELKGQVCADMILPYPPGIPVLMPGEMITDETISIHRYLQTLCDVGLSYPGFETDIHGLWQEADGRYYLYVIDAQTAGAN